VTDTAGRNIFFTLDGSNRITGSPIPWEGWWVYLRRFREPRLLDDLNGT